MTAFDPTQPVQTRDKHKVTIYCTDAPEPYPIHGRVAIGETCAVASWTLDGKARSDTTFEQALDLVNVPEPPRRLCVNTNEGGDGIAWKKEHVAKRRRHQDDADSRRSHRTHARSARGAGSEGAAAMSMDDPSVLGAGCGVTPLPTKEQAEKVWREAFAARLVFLGVDCESAAACANANGADLSVNPSDAADYEISYWDNDEGEA